MGRFKRFEEFVALLKAEHDVGYTAGNVAGYDLGYDVGVEEIFFNIWVKCWNIYYKFLEGELLKLMEEWLEEEKQGTLNTEPLPSPCYPKVKGHIATPEVDPSKAPEQLPPTNAEKEAVASNPPPIVE